MNQKNTNGQINLERENINRRISGYTVGKSARVLWNNKRRFRTI